VWCGDRVREVRDARNRERDDHDEREECGERDECDDYDRDRDRVVAMITAVE
jgi:hypothetical protein